FTSSSLGLAIFTDIIWLIVLSSPLIHHQRVNKHIQLVISLAECQQGNYFCRDIYIPVVHTDRVGM
ncbi:hypothetical protein ACIUVZ_004461, partial [Yersinia enterocolitica]